MRIVALKDVCNFQKGDTGLAKSEPGDYPLVATGADRKTSNTYQFDTKAVCIPLVSSTGHGHASLKHIHYQEGRFALGTILVALIAKDEKVLNMQFLYLYLSQLKDQILVPLMRGAANVSLSVTKIQNIEIPLPLFEEQTKIVEKYKSITVEEGELKAELNQQQDLLKKLRQQIIQEAIEGKLTKDWREQNPDVEPASELLKRIQTEKEQLIRDKKIKKQKALPLISEEEKPFELHKNWEWVRLGSVVQFNPRNNLDDNLDVSFIPMTLIEDGYKNKHKSEIRKWYEIKSGFTHFAENDVAISKITPCFQNRKSAVFSGLKNGFGAGTTELFILRGLGNTLSPEFILNIVKTDKFIRQGVRTYKGTVGQQRIQKDFLLNYVVALPSFTEQKEIVKKVEKLFAICNQLEVQISSSQTNAEELMRAVLKEALPH